MKKISKKELENTIKKHAMWIEDKKSGVKADLRNADLIDANLGAANFRDANLRDAKLTDADLGGADLSMANIRGADFRGGADVYRSLFGHVNFNQDAELYM